MLSLSSSLTTLHSLTPYLVLFFLNKTRLLPLELSFIVSPNNNVSSTGGSDWFAHKLPALEMVMGMWSIPNEYLNELDKQLEVRLRILGQQRGGCMS